MNPEFKENVILHIEDEISWIYVIKDTIQYSKEIASAYGKKPIHIESKVRNERSSSELEAEINRIGKSIDNEPALVSVVTAQVAKSYLNKYIPGVIISDTNFPLNGKKVVEWIRAHGFRDYALIGLSSSDIDSPYFDQELKSWFAKSNARYFNKDNYKKEELIHQVIRNRQDNMRRYKAE